VTRSKRSADRSRGAGCFGGNRNISEILAYHEATKHSPHSVRTSRDDLDWENQPRRADAYAAYPLAATLRRLTTARTSNKLPANSTIDEGSGTGVAPPPSRSAGATIG